MTQVEAALTLEDKISRIDWIRIRKMCMYVEINAIHAHAHAMLVCHGHGCPRQLRWRWQRE
jgi:hypothetical protein